MPQIMIIEDEPAIREELTLLLENEGYTPLAITEFTDVPGQAARERPDLILLDIGLPGRDGFSLCAALRKAVPAPVIFVTSRDAGVDEVRALSLGGDDYITKPFQAPILLAHIAAVLKRAAREGTEVTKLTHKGAELDIARGSLSFCGQVVELTKNELKIMHYLFLNKEKIVSRANLIEYLWDNQVFIDDNTLSVNMTRIRAKLEQAGMRDFIRTKRGMGYSI